MRPAPSKSAVYRLVSGELTTSARIKLTTSKTPIATWHGTASVGSLPPPQAHKSFPGYARGRSHPRGAAARHETSLGADIAESGPGGWSFGEQGGAFLASAEVPERRSMFHPALPLRFGPHKLSPGSQAASCHRAARLQGAARGAVLRRWECNEGEDQSGRADDESRRNHSVPPALGGPGSVPAVTFWGRAGRRRGRDSFQRALRCGRLRGTPSETADPCGS